MSGMRECEVMVRVATLRVRATLLSEELLDVIEAEETILSESGSTLHEVGDASLTDGGTTLGSSDSTDDATSCVIGHIRNRLCRCR